MQGRRCLRHVQYMQVQYFRLDRGDTGAVQVRVMGFVPSRGEIGGHGQRMMPDVVTRRSDSWTGRLVSRGDNPPDSHGDCASVGTLSRLRRALLLESQSREMYG